MQKNTILNRSMWTAVQAGNESIFMKSEAGAVREGEKERKRERTCVTIE